MKQKLLQFYIKHGRVLLTVLLGVLALAVYVAVCELYQYLALNVWS